jgi:hypothetical protein
MSHATARAKERLGFIPRPWQLLAVITAGQAKLVAYGEQERRIYDVPFEGTTVRVVVNKELDWVVSVLPPKFPREMDAERRKQSSKTRREFFRGRKEENEDE